MEGKEVEGGKSLVLEGDFDLSFGNHLDVQKIVGKRLGGDRHEESIHIS